MPVEAPTMPPGAPARAGATPNPPPPHDGPPRRSHRWTIEQDAYLTRTYKHTTPHNISRGLAQRGPPRTPDSIRARAHKLNLAGSYTPPNHVPLNDVHSVNATPERAHHAAIKRAREDGVLKRINRNRGLGNYVVPTHWADEYAEELGRYAQRETYVRNHWWTTQQFADAATVTTVRLLNIMAGNKTRLKANVTCEHLTRSQGMPRYWEPTQAAAFARTIRENKRRRRA